MRFAGDIFKGFLGGGLAGATGAYDPMKGVLGTMATSENPAAKGAFGLPGYLASGEAGNTANSYGFGLAGKFPTGLTGFLG